ncbi:CDP-alcohol phosphatidyltransferase family protein [Streptomyces sp. SID10815]|uniref:CDP-alcohol phosphatidyltransferase family protein n=1 Tax=Streptomyces sp. SID10815 TaxID=2706027 RepID=UPI0013C822C8|nr:CDP-alcohol phosphatidyltransferase family protein [Streptomyces sp. SID10815]
MALNNTYEARPVQQETAVGAGAQILLLALLGTAIGMGPAGWVTGLVFAIATWAVLSRAVLRSRLVSFGPANRVTLGRTVLVGAVTALVADSFESSPPLAPLVGLTTVALILDGVDGRVARRTSTVTALGARFDMEVDAFLILALSVHVSRDLGAWVLLIGGMRYAFVAAARLLPWLDAPLPPSTARKTVAAFQGVLLLLADAHLLPRPANLGVVLLALTLLVWSFGRDVRWLRRRADRRRAPQREADRRGTTAAGAGAGAGSSPVLAATALPSRPAAGPGPCVRIPAARHGVPS